MKRREPIDITPPAGATSPFWPWLAFWGVALGMAWAQMLLSLLAP